MSLSEKLNEIEPHKNTPKRVDSVVKPSDAVAWKVGVVGLFVLISIVDFLFALAGVNFFDFPGVWVVKAIDAAARGQVIAAIVGLTGGGVALFNYFLSFRQKQYHQDLQIANAIDIADENRLLQNEWEKEKREQLNAHFKERLTQEGDIAIKNQESQAKLERERLQVQQNHFDRQRKQEQAQSDYDAIAAEYDALSKDFVAKEELARINAAIGLASIAKKADPRKPGDGNEEKTNEIYPWFERVAMQLASALIIYDEPRARDQVRNSIRDIAKFDNVPGQQPLLTFLINTLADANRTAYKTFLETFAEGMACEKAWHLRTLARAVTIFPKPFENCRMLNAMRKQPDFALAFRAQKDNRRLTPGVITPGDPDTEYLKRLRVTSQQLADTRDAIGDCVKKDVRKIGVEFPEPDERIQSNGFDEKRFNEWQEKHLQTTRLIPNLVLSSCFLQGVKLLNAQLQGAKLMNARLQYAELLRAQLQGADLQVAQLQGANLAWARLQKVCLDFARLLRANLMSAQLQGASLDFAQLQGANLAWSRLQGAKLGSARLQEASLQRARLQGAYLGLAQLQGADFQEATLQDALWSGAHFGSVSEGNLATGIVWKDTEITIPDTDQDFKLIRGRVRDRELVKFLRANYPDGGPKEGEVWPDGLEHEEDYSVVATTSESADPAS